MMMGIRRTDSRTPKSISTQHTQSDGIDTLQTLKHSLVAALWCSDLNLLLTKPFHLSHKLCRLLFEAEWEEGTSVKLRDTMPTSELNHF